MTAAAERVAATLLAIAAGDRDAAAAEARAAGTPLGRALAEHLARRRDDVYTDPEGFRRFVDGGGNVGLYQAAEAALTPIRDRNRPRRVLDLGCGDGRLTVTTLHSGLERLDLVEPSARLLGEALARVGGRATEVLGHHTTAEAFLTRRPAGTHWDLAVSTFTLSALAPPARAVVLAALAATVDRLVLVEFDVPAFADRSAEHARYAAERYAAGVAEYPGDDVVVQGFLMPLLIGQFDPTHTRHTWEQPVAAWVTDLHAAGFPAVTHRPLYDFWWAPAHVVEALPA